VRACKNIRLDLDRPEVLEKYSDLIERSKSMFVKALNVSFEETADMKFEEMNQYSDAIFARNFEGILDYEMNESEWQDVYTCNNQDLL
jgi:hypothetical protein